jgi:hypothetical protein
MAGETFVLVLHVVLDIQLGVFLQRLGPVEIAGILAPIDWILQISRSVNNPDSIPIGLRTFRHEAFEERLGDAMSSHDVVEVIPKKHLSILVLGLEVEAIDGHNALVGSVVYVAGHGGSPFGNAFDIV